LARALFAAMPWAAERAKNWPAALGSFRDFLCRYHHRDHLRRFLKRRLEFSFLDSATLSGIRKIAVELSGPSNSTLSEFLLCRRTEPYETSPPPRDLLKA